jgi:hypothetical protein
VKIPTTLLDRVLLNEGLQVNVAVERDIVEIRHRFEHEGVSYLTITLPSLCDALDKGLAEGRFTLPPGFRAWRKNGKLPALMSGFFKRVFNEDASLRTDPCIDSIIAIRQVSRLFKKVKLPCSQERRAASYERYVQNDESLSNLASFPECIRRVAGYLWSDLDLLAELIYCSPGVFGTGATAEKYRFNERHSIKQWPERAEIYFPFALHGTHREDDYDSFREVEFLSSERERPVRVVQVPKTLKTPRTISVEPSYMMLMQQSVAKPLMDYLESYQFGMYSIRFADQSVNRRMARDGSYDGSLATIDLSDASDLVSMKLVKHLFEGSAPLFLDMIEACRSRTAKLPDGRVIALEKFASMGSALCFPIEAMVFYTIVMSAMVDLSGKRLSKPLLRKLTANVSVYGDDIIVPAEAATAVCDLLEACGLKVNRDKSFSTGLFRESCGGDYFRGVDITPVYVRSWDFSGNSRDPSFIAGHVSLSNQFYMKGLWNVSQAIRDDLSRRGLAPIPRTVRPCGVLTYTSRLFDEKLRWDTGSSGYRVKGYALVAKRRVDAVKDTRAAMLACFASRYMDERRNELRKLFNPNSRHSRTAQLSRQDKSWCDSWLSSIRDVRDQIESSRVGLLAKEVFPQDRDGSDRLATSVKPYALSMKRRWCPVHTGIEW